MTEAFLEEAIDTFATATELPVDTMETVLAVWEDAGCASRFRALLHGYVTGEDLAERTEAALTVAVHLLGEKADTASFPDLCALGRDPDRLVSVLGEDGVALTYPGILISTFDGDPAPLYRLIEAPDADEGARSDGFRVLGFLSRTGRLPERTVYEYLAAVPAWLTPAPDSYVWFGFAQAVAALGFSGLAGAAEAAISRGDVDPALMTSADFWQDLRDAQQNPGDVSGPAWDRLEPMGSTIEYFLALSEPDGEEAVQAPPSLPVRTTPKIGRNDPCPCGSGKKYKKCCLSAA